MAFLKSYDEFIGKVKEIDERLINVKIKSIEVDKEKQEITYNFICDKAILDLQEKILEICDKFTDKAFRKVNVKLEKIASDSALVNFTAYEFLKSNYPSVSIFMDETDISSVTVGEIVKFTLKLPEDGAEYVQKNGALKKLTEYLSQHFCSEFVGTTETKPITQTVNILSEEVYANELQKIMHRTIQVNDILLIDDASIGKVAQYICDLSDGTVTVCGKITEIKERQTKTGKPFFIIHLDDTTGRTSGVYFTRKSTYEKIKELKEGDAIIARANFGDYNGKKSLTFERINGCTFPEDFKMESKAKKVAPRNYKLIFPEQATTVKVKSVFDNENSLPEEILKNEYVVFDTETTGLDTTNDNVTEIGAIKIRNGIIAEQWTTLVCSRTPVSEEITNMTGISQEMVNSAPKIEEVFPDFMKFIDGTILVAHNSEFDIKMMKKYATEQEYEITNKTIDTMDLARELLPSLSHHRLNDLTDYFGVVLHHHRALSDAYATAEVFLELNRLKNK